ncbi:HlyD family efflux transporter periplasmic adaptor subunit [Pseudomonas paraeruginosa]|uniref:efflux RND transporter periplasmic adaptor subunit n=1 Tax=Pseudomonas aeruginosa group TaxID=136841 RepID=UPI00053D8962|nr:MULTISPECIES: HlyD family efflux transporter periplasmic adaptor subunit [Pseudomonas aeruginosa group]KAB0744427.1 HlyD family efflux transporter periplasmic adaptor subunit [Pseudomonas aeruginosa]MBG4070602.1 HlyD family efflux transporter periplasmic adaptor subunit [Pseudomonas aeruginosa]MBG5602896.1 HlyD family efflux transporter periplasmic adaptor subunit [Pseudomonas aeruginosa]MBH3674304.1 HlyD family efflux transporter periplasmic adaptor subunit [Pseudomonas aeruginosa]MBH94347
MTTDRLFSRGRRLLLIAAALLAAVALPTWLLFGGGAVPRDEDELWIDVRPSALVHRIGLVGRLEPGRVVTLAAPFAGNVEALLVQPGQRVEEGQELLRMETREIAVQVREARSALLKARRTLQELRDWERGENMTRARRALRSAQLAQDSTERKLRETRQLFGKGIVPRNELDDLEQQARQQRMDLEAARLEVEATRSKGQGENLQIAEMDLANATVKFETLQAQLDGRTVRAPFAGIIVVAPGSSNEQGVREPVQTGSKLGQGQALFGLASVERLKVSARVSELDINQLREGQEVEVSGDGFDGIALKGVISALGGQALPGGTQGSSPQFEVTVSVAHLTPGQLRKIRLGMSAKLAVTTYRNERALVVPPEAVRHEGDRLSVIYRASPAAPIEQLPVRVGRSTPEGVEVLDLAAGQVRVHVADGS